MSCRKRILAGVQAVDVRQAFQVIVPGLFGVVNGRRPVGRRVEVAGRVSVGLAGDG